MLDYSTQREGKQADTQGYYITTTINSSIPKTVHVCVCEQLTFNGDVLDGKTEDDCPNHSEGHFQVPVHNFCCTGTRGGGGGGAAGNEKCHSTQ